MFKKFVVALVKPVDFRQAEVSSQKISCDLLWAIELAKVKNLPLENTPS